MSQTGMPHPASKDLQQQFVNQNESEALFALVARNCARPEAGIFGPDSMSWKIDRESAVFLGAGRAALLQLAHPWVAAALADHSSLMVRPIDRFHGTFRVVFTMVFGSLDQALAAARHLYALHTRIRGELREDIAGWRRSSHYEANEIAALRWVYATLVESALIAYECVRGKLNTEERERYYAESRVLAGLFGIPAEALPGTWDRFAAYNAEMHASSLLGVSAEARAMAQGLLAGAGSWIHPPLWYRALTTEWLPLRFREEFGLGYGASAQRAADKAKRWLPRIYRTLPPGIRFMGPWHEARARIVGKHAGPWTRSSNRFWIGQDRLPFGKESILPQEHRGTTIAE